jgi:hypothetical protein
VKIAITEAIEIEVDPSASRRRATKERKPMSDKRYYEIDKEAVIEQIQKAVAGHARRALRGPYSIWNTRSAQKLIAKELNYYSTVRIVKLAQRTFVLVYGPIPNENVTKGTGPFPSKRKAEQYFLNGGR